METVLNKAAFLAADFYMNNSSEFPKYSDPAEADIFGAAASLTGTKIAAAIRALSPPQENRKEGGE